MFLKMVMVGRLWRRCQFIAVRSTSQSEIKHGSLGRSCRRLHAHLHSFRTIAMRQVASASAKPRSTLDLHCLFLQSLGSEWLEFFDEFEELHMMQQVKMHMRMHIGC